MERFLNVQFRKFLIFCPVATVMVFISQFIYINNFNKQEYFAQGGDSSAATYMEFTNRGDTTGAWLKRDFEWDGRTLDLNAQTFDSVLYNHSKDLVNTWQLWIDITDDCFINNAWCGTVEIHQHAGTHDEKIQTLDLRNYNLDDVKLDYTFDGDLLIPLYKGDYIIYNPSQKDSEYPIAAGDELTIGVIFYYFDTPDVFDYSLNYTYHRTYTYGLLYYIMLALIILFAIGLLMYIAAMRIYQDANRQLEEKKSGLLCMSDLYFLSYIIELEKDNLIPVIEPKDSTENEYKRPEELGAYDQIQNFISIDIVDTYTDCVRQFCDLSTLPERLEYVNSIAMEYVSRKCGWCSMRFFAMDRIEGRPVDRILFTVQIIDEEKRQMEAVTDEVLRAKNASMEQGTFLYTLAKGLETSAKNSEASLKKIISELTEYALLLNDETEFIMEHADIKDISEMVTSSAASFLKGKPVKFATDISDSIPEKIFCDRKKLEKVLAIMLENAAMHTNEGTITYSVFGGSYAGREHFIFSIRDTGDGKNDADRNYISIRLCDTLLRGMGSRLRMVSVPGFGNESYFELDMEKE